MPHRLDMLDHRLLDDFQRGLPLTPRPFAAMGAALGEAEETVINRLAALKAGGFISRVGATVRPNTAGASTLAAMAVPAERLEETAAAVGAEAGVNHSYLREDEWNLWFVATAPDTAELEAMLARIASSTGLRVLDLRLARAFNIDLGFSLSGKGAPPPASVPLRTGVMSAQDRPLLQALASGLPLVARPYAAVAAQLGRAEADVLERLHELIAAGIITRLGVIVHHRAMGWTANAMVVWELPEPLVAQAGHVAAAHPGVTLCYQRRTVQGVWPYTLYNMVHARSRQEAHAVVDGLEALPEFSGVPHRILFSTRCFKQTGALLHRTEAAA